MQACLFLCKQGRLWLPESFDRFIRDNDHHDNTLRYIEYNPVKAGLAPSPERWSFSSAYHREGKAGKAG